METSTPEVKNFTLRRTKASQTLFAGLRKIANNIAAQTAWSIRQKQRKRDLKRQKDQFITCARDWKSAFCEECDKKYGEYVKFLEDEQGETEILKYKLELMEKELDRIKKREKKIEKGETGKNKKEKVKGKETEKEKEEEISDSENKKGKIKEKKVIEIEKENEKRQNKEKVSEEKKGKTEKEKEIMTSPSPTTTTPLMTPIKTTIISQSLITNPTQLLNLPIPTIGTTTPTLLAPQLPSKKKKQKFQQPQQYQKASFFTTMSPSEVEAQNIRIPDWYWTESNSEKIDNDPSDYTHSKLWEKIIPPHENSHQSTPAKRKQESEPPSQMISENESLYPLSTTQKPNIDQKPKKRKKRKKTKQSSILN